MCMNQQVTVMHDKTVWSIITILGAFDLLFALAV